MLLKRVHGNQALTHTCIQFCIWLWKTVSSFFFRSLYRCCFSLVLMHTCEHARVAFYNPRHLFYITTGLHITAEWRPIEGNALINSAAILTYTSGSMSLTSSTLCLEDLPKRECTKHTQEFVYPVCEENTECWSRQDSHFAASRIVRGGGRNTGRHVAMKGKYTQMALTDWQTEDEGKK